MILDIQRLWNEGKTIDQIAHRIHSTRGKISGLVRRARVSGIFFTPRAKDTAVRQKKIKRDKATSVSRVPVIFENQILSLKYDECRFIINDDMSNPIFCRHTVEKVSYCWAHATMCYEKPRGRLK